MAENEIILLQRFAESGDAEAFSEIVRRHVGLVYGACLRVLEDKNRAADVVQETFLQLLRQAGQITGSVPSWLHRVATRKALDVVRADSRRRRREARYAADKPLKTTRWEDISFYVDEELDGLDDETREMLIKHFFEGQTLTDIAAKGGVSQPTVSRRVESGVTELREKLRSRGIIVAMGALGSLLVQSAAEAAPAVVLKELGKIALVGAEATAASGLGTAATASGAATKTAGGVLAGVKAKVVTAAAVAAVGVGGVVTYQHVTEPDEPVEPVVRVTEPVADTTPEKTVTPARTEPSAGGPETVTVSRPEKPAIDTDSPALSPPPDKPAATRSSDEPVAGATSSKTPRAAYGGTYWGRRAGSGRSGTSEEQEDPNDTESKVRRSVSRRRR